MATINGSLTLMQQGTILPEFEVTLYGTDFIEANTIVIRVNGEDYEFLVEEVEFDANSKEVKLWGRGTLAEFHIPFVGNSKYSYTKKTVSYILDDLLPGVTKNFQIEDSVVNFYNENTPLEACKALLTEIGAVAYFSALDNTLYIRYITNVNNEIEYQDVITFQKAKKLYDYNSVTVNYGGKLGFIQIECDKSSAQVEEMVDVKVYTLNPDYEFYTLADYYAKVEDRVVKVIEESIPINRNQNSFQASYPIKRILECPEWVTFNDEENSFYLDDSRYCNILNVKYETVYDVYRTTNYEAEKVMYCTAATVNSFTSSIGEGNINKTITSNVILDNVTAENKVRYELFGATHNVEATMSILYETGLNSVNGLGIRFNNTPYVVTGHSVNINGNPKYATSKLTLRGG